MEGVRRLVLFAVGNPGAMNRHSAGHYMLSHLASSSGLEIGDGNNYYSVGHSDELSLVKSLVYMNESGKALGSYLRATPLDSDSDALVILYDDFEVNSGKVKISPMKSLESHNGLSSCLKTIKKLHIDTQNIFKLGIGIGPKPKNTNPLQMSSWVLARFQEQELANLDSTALAMSLDYLQFIKSQPVKAVPEETSRLNKVFAKKFQKGLYK
ncbi:hypothetical protein CAAN1_08S01882 [[Candida] anglica]|uniref:Peptidyl-tRNA hydrolase n=1 Tax=[Candida] anglica TaxID=148631 RepID=A0ABP0EAE1_9ASCO